MTGRSVSSKSATRPSTSRAKSIWQKALPLRSDHVAGQWLTGDAACGHARFVDERVVVIGAGPAGLAAAWAIGRAGLDPLVVERAGAVAASWRSLHEQLRLNTHRMFSHRPGVRIPRRYGPFPTRDDYVAYLERYAAGMRVRFGTAAGRIDRAGPGWRLSLGGGSLSTAHVVVATGPDAEPVMPAWPGMAGFPGTLIHAGQFRSAGEMAGRDVLVVGPGNSGVDLLNHLARSDAARLWLSALGDEHRAAAAGGHPDAPGRRRGPALAAARPGRQLARRAAAGLRGPGPVRLSAL
jgi:NADPH-dependent 2,4-dienoyl-CoA reductase/sulfur reductase-like enzyme